MNSSAVQEAQKIAQACAQQKSKKECYTAKFKNLTKMRDMEFAKQVLSALQESSDEAKDCHFITHTISLAEAQKDPSNWQELLGKLDEDDFYFCSGGLIHGILEAHMMTDHSFSLTVSAFPTICGKVHVSFGQRSCYHHLGHILLAEEAGDVRSAVHVCNEIALYEARLDCLSGAFMENLTRTVLASHGIGNPARFDETRAQEIEELCRTYKQSLIAHACWKEMGHLYAILYTDDPAKVFASCQKASMEESQKECYLYSLGNMFVKPNFNPSHLSTVCSFYQKNDAVFEQCINRAVGAMLITSPTFSDWVIRFCISIPPRFQKDCFTEMGRGFSRNITSLEKREEYCKDVPTGYKTLCIGDKTTIR